MRKFFSEHNDMIKKGIVYFGILFLSYMMFMHYYITSDYIPNASLGGNVAFPDINVAMSGGRFINYFFMWFHYLLDKINISYYQNTFIIQLLGMMLYAYTGVVLFSVFSNYFEGKTQRILLDGAILLCFVNPFMVETYVYGTFDWSVGIFFAVLAAKKLAERKYVVGFFWALCATAVYQTNIFITLIICLIAVFLESYKENMKATIKRLLIVASLAVAVAGTSIALQKLVVLAGNDSSPGKEAIISENMIQRVLAMLSAAKNILVNMHGMLPRKGLFIFVAVLYLATIYVLVIKKRKIAMAVVWTALNCTWFIVPFCYGIVAGTAYAPRTILALFFSVSAFIIGSVYVLREYVKLKNIAYVWCGCFALVVFFYTETCIMDCYIRQALDFSEARSIQAEIEEYEEETGIEIETIVAGKSPKPIYYSPALHLSYEVTYNYRIMHDFWAQTRFINYVNQENYGVEWMAEGEYEKYFGTQSWDVFNPSEQLYFEGDTLYWAIY